MTPWGGAESAGRTWFNALTINSPDDIKIFPLHVNKLSSKRWLFEGTPIDYVKWCLRSTLLLKKICNKIDVDLIHIQSYAGYITIPPNDVPAIVTFHDEPLLRGLEYQRTGISGIVEKMLGIFAELGRTIQRSKQIWVHALSESIKLQLVQLGVPLTRIRVIPNGYSRNFNDSKPLSKKVLTRALNLEGDVQLILTVGAINARKGIHRLIEAARLLRKLDETIHIVAVGQISNILERSYARRLLDRVKQFGLSNFHLVGYVPKLILDSFWEHSDAYVSTSISEACNLALIEAASVGLPIVASDVGAARDLLGDEGILISRTPSPQQIASAMLESLQRKRRTYPFLKKIEWSSVAGEMIQMYERIFL